MNSFWLGRTHWRTSGFCHLAWKSRPSTSTGLCTTVDSWEPSRMWISTLGALSPFSSRSDSSGRWWISGCPPSRSCPSRRILWSGWYYSMTTSLFAELSLSRSMISAAPWMSTKCSARGACSSLAHSWSSTRSHSLLLVDVCWKRCLTYYFSPQFRMFRNYRDLLQPTL